VAAAFSNISSVYLAQSNYQEALCYAFDALRIREELGNRVKQGFAYENIAAVYLRMKDYDKAMEYLNNTLVAFRTGNLEADIARCLSNIATTYNEQGDYATALKYHFKALETHLRVGTKTSIVNSYINIGNAFTKQKKYAASLDYYDSALSLSREIGSESSIATCLGNMGTIFFLAARENRQGQLRHRLVPADRTACLKLSVKYLTNAVAICRKLNINWLLMEFSETLPKAHLLLGNTEKSLQEFEQFISLRDSVLSKENMTQVASLEAKRALELKDKDIIIRDKKLRIAALSQQNAAKERMIIIFGAILLIIIGSMVFVRLRRRIKKQRATLHDIAYYQAHDVRGFVARILGLVQMYNEEDCGDPENQKVIRYMKTSARELDETVKKIVKEAEV
jgi:tetratricopeptide (TPR) repeat protein